MIKVLRFHFYFEKKKDIVEAQKQTNKNNQKISLLCKTNKQWHHRRKVIFHWVASWCTVYSEHGKILNSKRPSSWGNPVRDETQIHSYKFFCICETDITDISKIIGLWHLLLTTEEKEYWEKKKFFFRTSKVVKTQN